MSHFSTTRTCVLALAALSVAGCAYDTEPRHTTAELAADPDGYAGERHWFAGEIELGSSACTLMECAGAEPCNQCLAAFVVGDGTDAVVLVAGDEYALEVGEHLALGCDGDEAEMTCRPAVPSRVTAIYGRVEAAADLPEVLSQHAWMIVVDDIELADGPSEQTVSGVHLTE